MRSLMIGLVMIAGGALGWDTAIATHPIRSHASNSAVRSPKAAAIGSLPLTSTVVIVPVRDKAVSSQQEQALEVERLQTRNRRLEALVRVLRNRELERQR